MVLMGLACMAFGNNYSFAQKKYHTSSSLCGGFPRVSSLKTPEGTCVGLVADQNTVPWKFPRKALSYDGKLYVSAFGGWVKNKGQVWELDLTRNPIAAKQIFQGTDRTHGLRLGPQGKIYFGDATAIYRFDPSSSHPQAESVISNLPDSYTLPNGKTIDSNHPLTEFIVLPSGNLIVNVGAPTNDCNEEMRINKVCAQRDVQAELRLYYYDEATDRYNPRYSRLARGLRNSMGLLFNEKTDEIYQAENSADQLGTPDELNVIDLKEYSEGRSYDFAWPFCYGNGLRYEGYSNYKTFCGRADKPLFLLPAHVSPLDMLVYQGKMFPELRGKILMSWHGWRPSGSRIAIFDTDEVGHFRSSSPSFLIDGWQEDAKGRHPKGRPVGLAEDSSGAIYVVDDQNNSLLIVASTEDKGTPPEEDDKSDDKIHEEDLNQIFSAQQLEDWSGMYSGLIQSRDCQSCHADVVHSDEPLKTLTEMINSHWIRPGGDTAQSDQLLWQRMTGETGVRIMPPPPSETILSGKGIPDSSYEKLKAWLEGL